MLWKWRGYCPIFISLKGDKIRAVYKVSPAGLLRSCLQRKFPCLNKQENRSTWACIYQPYFWECYLLKIRWLKTKKHYRQWENTIYLCVLCPVVILSSFAYIIPLAQSKSIKIFWVVELPQRKHLSLQLHFDSGCSKDTVFSENDFIFLKYSEKFSVIGINCAVIVNYIQSTWKFVIGWFW